MSEPVESTEATLAPERLAHPALRALAFAIDGIGTFVLITVIVFAGLFAGWVEAFAAIWVVPPAAALLATVLTATLGVTPAKVILRLRVVDAETAGRIGWRAILRSLVLVAPIALAWGVSELLTRFVTEPVGDLETLVVVGVPLAAWIALLVVLVVSPRYRGLQDRAGRSVVVRR